MPNHTKKLSMKTASSPMPASASSYQSDSCFASAERGYAAAARAIAPRKAMTVSQWADKERRLSSKACPDLPEDARATVLLVIASARNEWIRSTAKLVTAEVQAMADDGDDDEEFEEDAAQ